MNPILRKDTAKIPEDILNACKTVVERHLVIKQHEAEIARNSIIDAVAAHTEILKDIKEQTTKTNGRVTKTETELEKFKETYKIWLMVGGGVFSIILLIIDHFIRHS